MYQHIEFEHGWKNDIYKRITLDTKNLLIVADQMEKAGSSERLQDQFTKE